VNELVKEKKSSNPHEVEQLLQIIAKKSEENKQALLAMQKGDHSHSHHKKKHAE